MTRYVMLTQDNCIQCNILKGMLDNVLKGKYNDNITVVHRQSDEDTFMEYAGEYRLQGVPALINVETKEVLKDFRHGLTLKSFLEA